MPLLRLTLLAIALTSISAAASAIPGMNRYVSGSARAGDFGTCARGPCIRQAGTHTKRTAVLRPHN
jgi:hypothetical protein